MTNIKDHREENCNVIELKNISKSFPGVQALKDVSMNIHGGEIVAIVGENGAGKSTLMKVLAGIYPAKSFTGHIIQNKQEMKFASVQDAENAGIVLIPQELNVVPEMSIAENIFLNKETFFIHKHEMAQQARQVLQKFDLDVDPFQPIKNIGVGQRQICLLARALVREAKFVIFDEPTASIGGKEVENLFKVIQDLKKSRVGCIFVSHRIDEVLKIADRVIVLRNGEYITEHQTEGTTIAQIIQSMVGRKLSDMYYRSASQILEPVLELRNYSIKTPSPPYRPVVENINLEVRQGEIVSIFGLVGAGRTELVTSIVGMWKGPKSGDVRICGEARQINTPADAIDAGLALLSEDRHRFGTFMNLDVEENINLGSLAQICKFQVINQEKSRSRALNGIKTFRIKAQSPATKVTTLSGGNQQKVLLSRLLAMNPKVIILDEPTRGIDVGAKAEIFAILNQLTAQGMGILIVSSETMEVLGVSDRILVLYKGMVSATFKRGEATDQKLVEAATGGSS